MRRLPLLLVLALPLAGCPDEPASTPDRTRPPPAPPKIDWAKAFSYEVGYDAARGGVLAKVHIAPGFHAYTVGETTGRPMKLTVDAPHRLGEVAYPQGIEKNLPIGRSVIVEGDAEVFGPLETAADGPKTVAGTFAYQVCTDETCDRPRKAPFSVAVEAAAVSPP